jgi:hypothetical protein
VALDTNIKLCLLDVIFTPIYIVLYFVCIILLQPSNRTVGLIFNVLPPTCFDHYQELQYLYKLLQFYVFVISKSANIFCCHFKFPHVDCVFIA